MSKQTTLNSQPILQGVLNKYRNVLTASDQYGLPSFGLLSLLAEKTPMFIYDHPALTADCSTAFATQAGVFVHANTFIELLKADAEAKKLGKQSDGVIFMLTHELDHICRDHFTRCSQFNAQISNIAQDIRINMDKIRDLKLEPGTYLRNVLGGWGLTDIEATKFGLFPEELICSILTDEANQQNAMKNQNSQQQNGQQQSGQQQSGQQQNGQQQNGQQQNGQQQNGQQQNGQQQNGQQQNGQQQSGQPQNGQPQNGQPQNGQPQNGQHVINNKVPNLEQYGTLGDIVKKNNPDMNHTMKIEDFIDKLKKNDLENVLEKLGIDKGATADQIQDIKDRFQDQVMESFQRIQEIRRTNPNADKMPGQHIEDAVGYSLGELKKPKMKIESVIRDIIVGEGHEWEMDSDMPTDLFFQDPSSMGVEYAVYEESMQPREVETLPTIVIVDTSGSLYSDKETMAEFFSIAVGMVDEDDSAKVWIYSADTAIRGKPFLLNKDTLDDCIHNLDVCGNGGTEFTGPINTAINHCRENSNGLPPGGIIYITDLEASAPIEKNLDEDLPPLVFICREKDMNPEFQKRVANFAEVHAINSTKELTLQDMYEANMDKKDELSMSL